jgi:putative nucleotidyltransferase with HDIG domain
MNQISILSDSPDTAGIIGRELAGMFEAQPVLRRDLARTKPAQAIVVDIDLSDSSYFSDLQRWLMHRPKRGKAIFAVDRAVRRQAVQAHAIGATDILERPLVRKPLVTKLLGDIGALAGDPATRRNGQPEGILAGAGALEDIFDAVVSGTPIKWDDVYQAGGTLTKNIDADGLGPWLESVRQHHSQTYQHCLLVTGVAVAFGRHLGFSSADTQRLAFAGLIHDLGKAGIPVAILEKPGPLVGDEIAIMRRHPELGFEAARGMRGLDPAMLDMVVHHHEYLDGSGYPHGLKADQLSDLVRIMTIADIFGALVEQRSYRPPMTCDQAHKVLEDMGPKLDSDLVREFRAFATSLAR